MAASGRCCSLRGVGWLLCDGEGTAKTNDDNNNADQIDMIGEDQPFRTDFRITSKGGTRRCSCRRIRRREKNK